jgi:gliding motility-associated lipoprotein GldH
MTRTLFVLCFSAALFSCQPSGTIFEEHQKISEDLEWSSGDTQKITIPITDNSKPVQFILAFRYATGFQYDHMLMKISETDPDGNKTIREVEFRVRDENGEFIGEAGYDIIDLEYVLDEEKQFPVLGDYTYEMIPNMPTDTVHFAMEVGLVIRELPE